MSVRSSGPRSAKWRSRREGRVPSLSGVANNLHFIFLNVGWRIRPWNLVFACVHFYFPFLCPLLFTPLATPGPLYPPPLRRKPTEHNLLSPPLRPPRRRLRFLVLCALSYAWPPSVRKFLQRKSYPCLLAMLW